MHPVIASIKIISTDIGDRLTRYGIEVSSSRSAVILSQVFRCAVMILPIVFWFPFSVPRLHATTVVAIITKGRIVIGAESNVTIEDLEVRNGITTVKPRIDKVCKVRAASGIVFALDGATGNGALKLHFRQIIIDFLKESAREPDVVGRITVAIALIHPGVDELVRKAYERQSESYRDWLSGDPVLQGTFASFLNGQPRLHTVSFQVTVGPRGPRMLVPEVITEGANVATYPAVIVHGEGADEKSLLDLLVRTQGDVKAAKSFIERQIDRFKGKSLPPVGPPIVIAVAENGKFRWESHEGCPANE